MLQRIKQLDCSEREQVCHQQQAVKCRSDSKGNMGKFLQCFAVREVVWALLKPILLLITPRSKTFTIITLCFIKITRQTVQNLSIFRTSFVINLTSDFISGQSAQCRSQMTPGLMKFPPDQQYAWNQPTS